MSLGKPRLSLSKTEVAKLTQCLAMLPFPPLPVRIAQVHNPFDVDTDKDDYNAFEMATAQLRQDARTGDGILNSHSAVGAAIMFQRWRPKSQSMRATEAAARIDLEKTQVVLRLTYAALHTATPACCTPASAQDVYALFLAATQGWIDSMSPARGCLQLEGVPDVDRLGHEHAAHIVMSHYCYVQGMLYNHRGVYRCAQHAVIEDKYRALLNTAAEDPDSGAARKLDPAHCREKSMEMAELYSQHPFPSLLVLCFERLKNDCLSVYEGAPTEHGARFPAAVALLQQAVDKMNASVGNDMPALELDFGALGVPPDELARYTARLARPAVRR